MVKNARKLEFDWLDTYRYIVLLLLVFGRLLIGYNRAKTSQNVESWFFVDVQSHFNMLRFEIYYSKWIVGIGLVLFLLFSSVISWTHSHPKLKHTTSINLTQFITYELWHNVENDPNEFESTKIVFIQEKTVFKEGMNEMKRKATKYIPKQKKQQRMDGKKMVQPFESQIKKA